MSKICPYYKGGYCTSPMLPNPDDTITSSQRCMTEKYITCRYYVPKEEDEEKKALENYIYEPKEIIIFSPVNVLDEPRQSECEFFQILKTDKGYIAKCRVMNRVLTKSHVNNCANFWLSCPIRRTVIK